MPALVDYEGPEGTPYTVFESGAIMMYLAEKTGSLLPKKPALRYDCLQWLMFQIGGVGPMFGQAHHFMHFASEKVPYGIERYGKETKRLYGVMNTRLGKAPYLGGKKYSIADMAVFPWTLSYERQGVDINDFPKVKEWSKKISERQAVKRALAIEL